MTVQDSTCIIIVIIYSSPRGVETPKIMVTYRKGIYNVVLLTAGEPHWGGRLLRVLPIIALHNINLDHLDRNSASETS